MGPTSRWSRQKASLPNEEDRTALTRAPCWHVEVLPLRIQQLRAFAGRAGFVRFQRGGSGEQRSATWSQCDV